MEIQEFTTKIRKAIEKELGEEYRVEIREVTKNNGSLLRGLLIISKEENLIPTIYLDSFFEAYEEGMPLSDIVTKILDLYHENSPKGYLDMDFFRLFENVRDKICYKVINREENKELLNNIPSVDFLDLSICFFYAFSSDMIGDGTILIYNSHMEYWGVTVADLMRAAEENTPRLFPAELRPLGEVLAEMLREEHCENLFPVIPLSVLTNQVKSQGACCIMYPGILEDYGRSRDCNFYIIPSSIHEVLLVDDDGSDSAENLKSMIADVNNNHVAAEEILSYNLYYYNLETKSIVLL